MKNHLKILLLILTVGSFISSCNTAKKIEKKDTKALQRVEANINLLNQAGQLWSKLNPCYPDTIKKGIIITVIDSTSANGKIDSLNSVINSILNNYPSTNIDSLRLAITKEVEKRCKPIIINHYQVDTLPPDRRAIELLQQKNNDLQNTISKQEGSILILNNQITDLKKSKTKTMWIMGGGLFLLLIVVGFLVYLQFKTK